MSFINFIHVDDAGDVEAPKLIAQLRKVGDVSSPRFEVRDVSPHQKRWELYWPDVPGGAGSVNLEAVLDGIDAEWREHLRVTG